MASRVVTCKCSWSLLAGLRRRGQKPMDGVWITDHDRQRRNLEDSGLFTVGVPEPEEIYLTTGLDVFVIAEKSVPLIALVQQIAACQPSRFVVLWRGHERQEVLPWI